MSFAFVFPGQGSQSVGMLADLSNDFSIVKETFSEASDALDYDLWALTQSGPAEDLNQTMRTQPAMLAAGVAVWRSWQTISESKPDYLAGHSLGEYTALVASGSLSFQDAIKLVEQRGLFMQDAVPAGSGAMAAILGLSDDDVIAICQKASTEGVVEAVNFNCQGQVGIAGQTDAVNYAIKLAKEGGAKRALLLSVGVPSHCALMKPAAEKLTQALLDINVRMPSIPVIHNSNVATASSTDEIKSLLAQQLFSPVRWVETISLLGQKGSTQIIECGPGKVLAGLTKRIDKSLSGLAMFDKATMDKVIANLGE
jgi:[acyl-carrier-protein] S-malonyltransferase